MSKPRWILDDEWAVGTDAYSWIIFARTYDKETGEPKGWKARSWYPDANQLLESLLRKVSRTDDTTQPLHEYLEYVYGRVEALSEAFSEQLKAEVWEGLKRPQRKVA